MDFKHWKEAEKRASELSADIEAQDKSITALEDEARNADTAVERREVILSELKDLTAARAAKQSELAAARAAEASLRAEEEKQFGLLNSLHSERIASRVASGGLSVTDTLASRQYELAWAKAVRTKDASEARALLGTPDNQLLVPKTLAARLEDALFTGGRLISLCSTVSIKGLTEYPVVANKSDPALHAETGGAKKPEKDVTLMAVTMEPQFIAEIMRTTRKFEADSVQAFFDWVMSELPDALRRVIDAKILSGGQGAGEGVHGVLTNANTGGAPFVAELSGHVLNFNSANEAVAMLGDGRDENVTIVVNRKTFYSDMMGFKDTSDRPIYMFQTDNEAAPRVLFGGFPVEFSSELPAYRDADDGEAFLVAGDFKAFTLNFPLGMNVNIVRDDITEMEHNFIRYLSEIYVAGNITRIGSFVKVTK